MTWLVTGSEGRLGARVVQQLDAAGHSVRTFDSVRSSREGHVAGDLRDSRSLETALRDVDLVIHLAALASDSAGTPDEILSTNTYGTIALADRALASGCSRFVYASSINAFGATGPGTPDYLPLDTNHSYRPLTPYQISKHLAESYLLYMHRSSSLDVAILQPPFIAGPGHYREWRRPDFDDLPRTRNELFAYVDLDDCARAFLLAAAASGSEPGPFLLSAEDSCATDTSRELVGLSGVRARPDIDEYLAEDPHRSLVDARTTTAAIGWQPTISWRTAPSQSARARQGQA